ncbi:hypothetical protein D9M70_458980 [compost metagenome]
MTCSANDSLMENREISKPDMAKLSERKQSAGHSKFQRIGWILKIIEESLPGFFDLIECSQGDFDGAVDAMEKYSGLTEEESEYLLALISYQDRFEYAWRNMDEEEQDIAIRMDYKYWQNFWPGFEMVQIGALEYLKRQEASEPDSYSLG